MATSAGAVTEFFRFDTGADVTTVSEDVANRLGLPPGGPPVQLSGSTGAGVDRLVSVNFRFPPDAISGRPCAVVSSTWAVVPVRAHVALLSFSDVEPWFYLGTDDTDMIFTDR